MRPTVATHRASAPAPFPLKPVPARPRVTAKQSSLGLLVFAETYAGDWEVLVYKNERRWEACFFKWDSHHEHLTAASFTEARHQAEQRIDIFEGGGAQIVAATKR